MAILENRSKINSNNFRLIKSLTLNLTKILNISTFLTLGLLLFSSKTLSPAESLTEFSGSIGTTIIRPFINISNSISQLLINTTSFSKLHEENIKLKIELAKTQGMSQMIQALSGENAKLSKELNLATTTTPNTLKAKLLFQNNSDSECIALIAAGKKHGVQLNQIVTANNYLAGRIITVSDNFSKVLLVNGYNSRIPVKTYNTNIKAIMVGDVENAGHLIHLPPDQRPKLGEIIVTSGDGKYYPSDIPVARVSKTDGSDIAVSTFYDLSKTEFVNVIDNFEQ